MDKPTVSHAQVAVSRTYETSAERLFRAWSDPTALGRWYLPGDAGWTAAIESHDFRPGGGKHLVFGPPGEPPLREDARYEVLTQCRLICYVMTISRGGAPMTTSMVTVEFLTDGPQVTVAVTEQMAILDAGETPEIRERGWVEVLDKLGAELARA